MKNEYIRKEDAEMLFRNARKNLLEEARKGNITDVNTRDLMLLNAEQMIHLLPSVQPKTDILDKIRAEIMDFEEDIFHSTKDYSDYAAVRHCVDIIDKYRKEAGSEV